MKRPSRIPIPKKYSISIIDEATSYTVDKYQQIRISLVRKESNGISTEMGYVRIEGRASKGFETHSFLRPSLRGKGYGALIYGVAIQYCLDKDIKIGSSYYPSDQAIRLWDSKLLNSNFNIRKTYHKEEKSFQFRVLGSRKNNIFKQHNFLRSKK